MAEVQVHKTSVLRLKHSTATAPLVLLGCGSWKDYQDVFDAKGWDRGTSLGHGRCRCVKIVMHGSLMWDWGPKVRISNPPLSQDH